MAYTIAISVSLGSSKAGLSLSSQLFDTNGTDVGDLVTTGFAEIGQGNYIWTYAQFPDGFRGGVKFYNSANPGVVLAATSINPEDAEYIAKLKQDVEDILGQISATPKEITIEVPHIATQSTTIDITAGSTRNRNQIEIKTGVR